MELGEIIKNLRKEQNITQDELAKALNVSSQSISKWETNNCYPDITFIPDIAKFFKVSIDTLFSNEHTMPDDLYKIACCSDDSNLELWEKYYFNYPNDYRVQKKYMSALCLKNNPNSFEKIIEIAIKILSKCENENIKQSTLLILKSFLYNQYEIKQNEDIEAEILDEYNNDKPLSQNEITKLISCLVTNPVKISSTKRVIIVDDAKFMRTVLNSILNENGYTVVAEAENGLQVIDIAAKLEADLIIMDIKMPELNGIEALKTIKLKMPELPIIMCSAMAQQSIVLEAIKNGAIDFIAKPFMAEGLIKIINNHL